MECKFAAFAVFLSLLQQCLANVEDLTAIKVPIMNSSSSCDIFEGSWVYNDGYGPYYNASTCPFLSKEFNCQGNGRPDQFYLKYRWKPNDCNLPRYYWIEKRTDRNRENKIRWGHMALSNHFSTQRFDGQDIVTRFKGKKIMFVGDSLSLDQWQSFTCMLVAALPHSQYKLNVKGPISTLSIKEYDLSVMLYRTPFLVDVVTEKRGKVLKLDSINNGNAWRGMDLLIFNSWHWWVHTGSHQGWDYIQIGNKVYKDMDRIVAYKHGLTTWSKWVETNTHSGTTQVYFQGISPTHYRSQEWNATTGTCKGETRPVPGSKYPADVPAAAVVVKEILNSMSTKVTLLDITTLSQLRKDGHPSIYGLDGNQANDCSHWCLPGVPDTWNELLVTLLVSQAKEQQHINQL